MKKKIGRRKKGLLVLSETRKEGQGKRKE